MQFELGCRRFLDALAAEADDVAGLALVDREVKVLDRSGPIGTGLQHVADPPLKYPDPFGLVCAFKCIDLLQEIIVRTVRSPVTLDLRIHRLVLTQSLAQDRIEADADAAAIAVFD